MFAEVLLAGGGLEAASEVVSKIVTGIIYFWIALGILGMVLVLVFAVISWNKGGEA